MANVEIMIPGRLAGWGRARVDSRGGKVRHFTSKQTRSTEDTIRFFAREAMKGRPLFTGPLHVIVDIWRTHPKSWPKKWKQTVRYVTGRPDIDNVMKGIGDSCNHIVWVDDSQIAVLEMYREYTDTDRVRIRVCELEDA